MRTHLEDWGKFGMGWSQVNAWARLLSPDTEPIWLQAAVWSVLTPGPVTGNVVYLSLVDAAQLRGVKGTSRLLIELGKPRRHTVAACAHKGLGKVRRVPQHRRRWR